MVANPHQRALRLAVPSLASGTAADEYVARLTPLGAVVEAIGPEPGTAATRKLLRSVVAKGLAGVVIEALRAAHAAGEAEWLWHHVVDQLTGTDEDFVRRLVTGTGIHHARRRHEMEASAELLRSLGVDPVMTRATVAHLARIAADGVPPVPEAAP